MTNRDEQIQRRVRQFVASVCRLPTWPFALIIWLMGFAAAVHPYWLARLFFAAAVSAIAVVGLYATEPKRRRYLDEEGENETD